MEAQRQIDFVRGEQLRLLRDCELPAKARDRSGHGVTATVLKAVLNAIDQYGRGRSGGCYASMATIAKCANMGQRTATRAVEVLQGLGLLCVSTDGSRHGHRGALTNRYTIVWSELALLCDRGLFARPPTHQSAPRGALFGDDQSAPGADQSAPGADQSAPGAHKACMKRIETYSTSSSCEESTSDARAAPDWEVVVEAVLRAGVTDAQAAVERARTRGVGPEALLEILSHHAAHPGCWGLGALHRRLRDAWPGQPVEAGWPPPRGSRETRVQSREAEASRQQLATQRQREANLEALWGPVLDGLSADDRDNLAEAVIGGNPLLRGLYRTEGCTQPGLVRLELLAFLCREAEQVQ